MTIIKEKKKKKEKKKVEKNHWDLNLRPGVLKKQHSTDWASPDFIHIQNV